MPLYVVLRHRDRPDQSWSNGWRDDKRLVDAITTYAEVARLCREAQDRGEYVYVHRCAHGSAGAEITSRAKVRAITKLDRDFYVAFDEPEPVTAPPRVQPAQGQDYYFDGPPSASLYP